MTIFTDSYLFIFFVIALLLGLFARFISNIKFCVLSYIVSFLFFIAGIIYALLRGVKSNELLTIILLFTSLNLTSFFSIKSDENANLKNKCDSKNAQQNNLDILQEQTEEQAQEENDNEF